MWVGPRGTEAQCCFGEIKRSWVPPSSTLLRYVLFTFAGGGLASFGGLELYLCVQ